MLNWFEKSAPIKLKFKVLLVILGLFTAGGIATTYLAALADPAQVHVYLAVACVLTALTMATVFVAGKLISDPYVATVVRMEGLAAGDLTTPIANTAIRGSQTKAASAIMHQPIAQITCRKNGYGKPKLQPKLSTVISRKISQSPRVNKKRERFGVALPLVNCK
jgi:hypothetical protein